MSHDLDLGGLSIDYEGAGRLEVASEFGANLSLFFFFGLFDQTLPCERQMFSELNVLLLTSQFFYFFLHTFHKILCNSVLRCARFADAHG
jgi:hypothetical protein